MMKGATTSGMGRGMRYAVSSVRSRGIAAERQRAKQSCTDPVKLDTPLTSGKCCLLGISIVRTIRFYREACDTNGTVYLCAL